MSNPSATPARSGPVFPVSSEKRFPRVLWGFGLLSLFGHALAFFLFRVVYPPVEAIKPPTPTVSLLRPGTPEDDAMLRWVAAEDPSLVASSVAAKPPLTVAREYQPSYATPRTPPRTLPWEQEPPVLAPTFRSLSVEGGPKGVAPAPKPELKTRVALAGALSGAAWQGAPTWNIQTGAALEPATFLVGVDAQGVVQFAFVQHSSRDASVDAAAAQQLRGTKVEPAPPQFTWGFARVEWGDEVYAQAEGAK